MSDSIELMVTDPQDLAVDAQENQAVLLDNLLINSKQLNQIYKIAKMYAASSMVPANYQNNPSNCFVACELAARMNVSPILIFQSLWIVQGKPSWSGQACKSLIDGSGKFKNSEYVMTGEVGTSSRGCFLQAVNTRTGKLVKGAEVTLKMATDEGWSTKSGSKWRTMPELMLRYRAAAFFARTECPEVLMGFQTADETEDVRGTQNTPEVITINI